MKTKVSIAGAVGMSLALVLSASDSAAGTNVCAPIVQIDVYTGAAGGTVMSVQCGTNGTGKPACAATTPAQMVIDMRNETGRAMAVVATSAYLTGKNVTLYGLGFCTVHTETETVEAIRTPG